MAHDRGEGGRQSADERRFRALIERSWDAILLVSREGKALYASPSNTRILGYREDEFVGLDVVRLTHAEDSRRLGERFAKLLRAPGAAETLEFRARHRDGAWVWLEATMTNLVDDPAVGAVVFNYRDVTERREAEGLLVQRAYYDPLTELPNRDLFMDRLSRAVERAHATPDYRFAVVFLDLDRFKVINDSLGHLAGDRLIAAISRRLMSCVRPSDMLARLGGDEFGVLLDLVDESDDPRAAADRIKAALAEPFTIDGTEVFSSASVGISVSAVRGGSADEMLRQADVAMYRAKAAGKARYVVYDATLHEHVLQLMRFETELRGAVERRELFLDYQPIVELDGGNVVGFEALVRWRHPARGVVPPSEFIPLAEETGLILEIDRAVLRDACRQLRDWQGRYDLGPDFTVSVNFSGKQFSHADVADAILGVLEETGVDARNLELEITENALIENAEVASYVLERLRAVGIRMLVDDFGTGYSSLSYLHRFPIDTIKIDRSFVSRMDPADGRNEEIIRAITALAWGLGMEVIAEGVETAEQAERLIALRCGYAQGHHFYRPIPPEQAERLLASRAKRT